MGVFHWIFGKHEPRRPCPERTCEAAWLPMWQAPMIVDELNQQGVAATMSEDLTSHLRFGARGPMARIYVMEPQLVEAESIIEEITGYPPAHQGL